MPHERLQSKLFLAVVLGAAALLLVLNVLSLLLAGWQPAYLRIVFNLVVILSLVFKYRHAKLIVKIWAALPIVSLGLYLLTSAHKDDWSGSGTGPAQRLIMAGIGLALYLWADKAFVTKTDEQT